MGCICFWLLAAIAAGCSWAEALAGSNSATYRSRNFLLWSDLSAEDARALLERLESTLRIVSRYWGRPLRRPIECYVLADAASWPAGALPNPHAQTLLLRIGGGTDLVRSGGRGRGSYQARLYAISQVGVAEHELVHAYCAQVFGAAGPDWYKEGMAELAGRHTDASRGVQCAPEIIQLLRHDSTRSIGEIVNAGEFTAPIATLFSKAPLPPFDAGNGPSVASSVRWRSSDDRTVLEAKKSYYWSWALCHFLAKNPNYNRRFRLLGQGFLNRENVSFDQMFGAVSEPIAFEFELFLQNIENGYRVDLCRWDWAAEFSVIRQGTSTVAAVQAARGYQASGLFVAAGKEYEFKSAGTWSTGRGAAPMSADGDVQGRGRLVGAVLHDFTLSEPFQLGSSGSFSAPRNGRLYLRCQDHWYELADNEGVVRVSLRPKPTAVPPAGNADGARPPIP